MNNKAGTPVFNKKKSTNDKIVDEKIKILRELTVVTYANEEEIRQKLSEALEKEPYKDPYRVLDPICKDIINQLL